MSRASLVVRLGRLIQRLPISVLRPLELLLLGKRYKKEHLIFLLALPRGGSTLTYQVLCQAFNPFYLSNLSNLLFQLPLFGSWVTGCYSHRHKSTYMSKYGFVSGLFGPAEGLAFWKYWFANGLVEANHDNFSNSKLEKRVCFLRKVFSVITTPRRPFVSGYLGHLLMVRKLRKSFPNAIFFCLHRDPIENALSILRCREKSHSSKWFSVCPKECEGIKQANIYEQVAAQVYWLNKRLDEVDGSNVFHTNYEDLCGAPEKVLDEFVEFCKKKDLKMEKVFDVPKLFKRRTYDSRDLDDCEKIRTAFKKLERKYGI